MKFNITLKINANSIGCIWKNTKRHTIREEKTVEYSSLNGVSVSHMFSQKTQVSLWERRQRFLEAEAVDGYSEIAFSGLDRAVAHMNIVTGPICTRLAQDQAWQNASMDRKVVMVSHPYLRS